MIDTMGTVDFSPFTSAVNNLALHFAIWIGICFIAYAIVFITLRQLKVPNKFAHYLSTGAFFLVMYFTVTAGHILDM
jgi:vacuolar-type H+-ATPase subunit I/STV1